MNTTFELHRLTVHDPSNVAGDPRLRTDFRRMDPRLRPPQTKTYAQDLERVDLSDDIEGQRLSRVLFLSAGVVRVAGDMLFRAAGSAGNLQPLEVYVLAGGGLFHYDAPGHALVRLRKVPGDTPTTLIVTGVPWRTGWKYGERGFRHLYWDCGSMLAQTLELEPAARVEMGFVDAEVTALVGADGVHEFPLAVVPLDGETVIPEPAPVPAGHVADDPIEFPLVTQAQRAGDLLDRAAADAWRAEPPMPSETWSPTGDLAELIRRRGSTREFDPRQTGPNRLLTGAMAWATRPVPADFAPALEHFYAVHAIEGVEPGVYRWRTDEPLLTGDAREASATLCLGQPLGGSGVYTVFHCSKVHELDDRSYRAALLEAGVTSGRLHLAAFSLGFGATGLTYLDEQVRRFFKADGWPLLVTAVGAPAYRSRKGGLPRRPVELGR